MLSVSAELKDLEHPLVQTFHIRREFGDKNQSRKILVIETNFAFSKKNGHIGNEKLITLLADLENMMPLLEKTAGKFDCIDLEPPQTRQTATAPFLPPGIETIPKARAS